MEYQLKCILLGDSGAGKSAFLYHFIHNINNLNTDVTIGIEYNSKFISIDNNNIQLQIYDTAGLEQFRSITQSYYRNAALALIFIDGNSEEESNTKIQYWYKQLRKVNNERECFIGIVITKIDLPQYISRPVCIDLPQLPIFQTSAKDGVGINEVFLATTTEIINRIQDGRMIFHTGVKPISLSITEITRKQKRKNNIIPSCC